MNEKRCKGCGVVKPYSEYHKGKSYIGGVISRCKDCTAKKNRRRYLANREHILETSKLWRDAHPELCREYIRNRRKNKPDEVKKWQREYAAKHPDLYCKATREWSRRNPEKVRARNRRQNAIRRGADYGDFTAEQWAKMKSDWDYQCAYCGKAPEELTQDHIQPLSQGGNHTAANIVPACRSCNSRKNARTPAEAGMTLRRTS